MCWRYVLSAFEPPPSYPPHLYPHLLPHLIQPFLNLVHNDHDHPLLSPPPVPPPRVVRHCLRRLPHDPAALLCHALPPPLSPRGSAAERTALNSDTSRLTSYPEGSRGRGEREEAEDASETESLGNMRFTVCVWREWWSVLCSRVLGLKFVLLDRNPRSPSVISLPLVLFSHTSLMGPRV